MMRALFLTLCLLALCLLAASLAAQPYYNLDFETVSRNPPRNWLPNGAGQIAADDSIAARGACILYWARG